MNKVLKKLKRVMTPVKLTKEQKQYKSDQKARAKYLTNPTKVFNPKIGKYF